MFHCLLGEKNSSFPGIQIRFLEYLHLFFHKKHFYLSFRDTIFFSELTKSYKHSNSKGTLYLKRTILLYRNTVTCHFVNLLFFLQPPPVFLMSTFIMWRVEFKFRKILFFLSRVWNMSWRVWNKILWFSFVLALMPFLLTICRHWSTIISTLADTFCPADSYSIYVQVLSCRLLARNGRRWPKLHLFNVDVTQKVFKLTLDALDCLGSILSDISGANIFHQIFPKEILQFFTCSVPSSDKVVIENWNWEEIGLREKV